MIQIKQSTFITISLVAGQGKYPFGVQHLLSGRRIKHVFQVLQGQSPEGLVVRNLPAFLELKNPKNETIVDQLTTTLLFEDRQNPVQLEIPAIVWEKSFVTVADPAAINAGDCLLFSVVYE